MRKFLVFTGVCLLLVCQRIEAKTKNRKQFWDLFPSRVGDAIPTSSNQLDLTLAELEGSGDDLFSTGDDEDLDVISGFGDNDDDDTTVSLPIPDDHDDNNFDFGDEDDKLSVTSDDEDLTDGSGSGDDEVVTPPIIVNPPKSRTACENLRATALNVAEYVPECDSFGGFKKQQCTVDSVNKRKYCWCVDPDGVEISGTRLVYPKTPDCDFGTNLSTCVFQLVQHSQGLIGEYRPACTKDGDYEAMQCQGSECWCVDHIGQMITGTVRMKPELPNCEVTEEPIVKQTTKRPLMVNPGQGGYTIKTDKTDKDTPDDVIVNIGKDIPIDDDDDTSFEDNVGTGGENDSMYAPTKHSDAILAQPGLLAAIIGGSVVLLLVLVLLVMFIVYRMRKKDEGSYPLDEQKYQNYTYQKAPDKEFYA